MQFTLFCNHCSLFTLLYLLISFVFFKKKFFFKCLFIFTVFWFQLFYVLLHGENMQEARFWILSTGITSKTQNFFKAVDSHSCSHPNSQLTSSSNPHQPSCDTKFSQIARSQNYFSLFSFFFYGLVFIFILVDWNVFLTSGFSFSKYKKR